jgi:glutathione synthase/RimK-type ligase-like ATP-grasp enzyme
MDSTNEGNPISREILLRTLRLNLIPAPRVITPGPATRFPVIYETPKEIIVVMSLKEVRSGSWDGGFFREYPAVTKTRVFQVEGYSATAAMDGGEVASAGYPAWRFGDGSDFDLTIRAAYCLGLHRAEVELGYGEGGPWVLDVRIPQPQSAQAYAWHGDGKPTSGVSSDSMPGGMPAFVGAEVEYLRIHPDTGEPQPWFYTVRFSPEGEPESPEDAGTDGFTWISSPMPFPDMPLSTRLIFKGVPDPSFVRSLDESVAVMAMMASPVWEDRERHSTQEGLLGSIRPIEDGFEYVTAPSLLWNTDALREVIDRAASLCGGTAGAVTAGVSRSTAAATGAASDGPAARSAKERYLWQKAYYNCDKAFFAGKVPGLDPLAKSPAAPVFGSLWAPGLGYASYGSHRSRPVLGIMAKLVDGPRRFGIETDRFKELIKAAGERGITAYVFYPPQSSDTGWTYRERRGWSLVPVPPPDVVYDRHIPDAMPSGQTPDVAREYQEARPDVQFVNSLSFVRACRDKFAAHTILSGDPFIARYLPETITAEDPDAVAAFAEKRERTYLKLRGGTGSKGIILIENMDGGRYRVTRRSVQPGQQAGAPESNTAGRQQLLDMLHEILVAGGGAGQYIAQDGIDLARAPELGDVFEVRVICQKGGAGKWLRTGMVCRLHPSAGGFIIPREELHVRVDDMLGRLFPGRVAAIKDEVREIARRIPPVLEAGSGRGGEMSVDLGIDVHGRPRLIEVNSKPASLFRDIAAFELRRLSLRRIVNYSAYLFDNR